MINHFFKKKTEKKTVQIGHVFPHFCLSLHSHKEKLITLANMRSVSRSLGTISSVTSFDLTKCESLFANVPL